MTVLKKLLVATTLLGCSAVYAADPFAAPSTQLLQQIARNTKADPVMKNTLNQFYATVKQAIQQWVVNPYYYPSNALQLLIGTGVFQHLAPKVVEQQHDTLLGNAIGYGIVLNYKPSTTTSDNDILNYPSSGIQTGKCSLNGDSPKNNAGLTSLQDQLSCMYASDFPSPVLAKSNNISQESLQAGNKMFSMTALLGPTTYSNEQERRAQAYIGFITGGFIDPQYLLDFPNLVKNSNINQYNSQKSGLATALGNAESNQAVRQYRFALRNIATIKGTGMANLMHYYSERAPLTTTQLNQYANDPQKSDIKTLIQQWQQYHGNTKASPSLLQIEHFAATRRLGTTWQVQYTDSTGKQHTSDWHTAMLHANEATLQRETVYLLAEMRAGQFRQTQELERLNTTLSAMMLQTAQVGQNQLRDASNAARRAITGDTNDNQNQQGS